MTIVKRLAVGTAIAAAMIVPVGTASAADDVHINSIAGPYPTWNTCEAARLIVEFWGTTGPCTGASDGWRFWYL